MARKLSERMLEYLKRKAAASRLRPVEYDNVEDLELIDGLSIPYDSLLITPFVMARSASYRTGVIVGLVLFAGALSYYAYRFLEDIWSDLKKRHGLGDDGAASEAATSFASIVEGTMRFVRRLFGSEEPAESDTVDVTPMPTMPGPIVDETEPTLMTPSPNSEAARRAVANARRTYEAKDPRVAAVREAAAYAAKQVGVQESLLLAVGNKESRLGRFTNNVMSSAKSPWQLLPGTFEDIRKKYSKQFPVLNMGINNPKAAAVAAALYLKGSGRAHRESFGRDASATEHYVYYLLGRGGGKKFLAALAATPNKVAATDWRKEAAANPSVFYDVANGRRPRTYKQIFDYLTNEVGTVASMFAQRLRENRAAPTMLASEKVAPVAVESPSKKTAGRPIVLPVDVRPSPIKVDFPDLNESLRSETVSPAQQSQRNEGGSSSSVAPNTKPQGFLRGRQGLVFAVP